jgi:uncharacterized membrane protein YedE/YeeE
MAHILAGLLGGLVFGIGLSVSHMTDPAVVLGFLDFFGEWNPALMFVMVGGIGVTFVGYKIVFGRGRPILEPSFNAPISTQLDGKLLTGAGIFGIGWGMAGFCPGPALASLSAFNPTSIAFVVAMLIGMELVRLWENWRETQLA